MSHTHFSDLLLNAIDEKGAPVCVGIDPVAQNLPKDLREQTGNAESALDAVVEFSSILIDAIADHVPAVKFQSACFERYRAEGVEALFDLIGEANQRGLIVILDAKRGDIGISSQHYADGLFNPPDQNNTDSSLIIESDPPRPDAVTANAYLGLDGLEPFCQPGHGLFALIRTSNPGSDPIQEAKLQSGDTVAEHIARLLNDLARNQIGERGYSDVGAVIGATKPQAMTNLRKILPNSIFLVPGYGAQGGQAEDIRAAFNADSHGAIITASRSIIYAFDPKRAGSDWIDEVAAAAERFANEIATIVK